MPDRDVLDVPYWIDPHPYGAYVIPLTGEVVPPEAVPVDVPPDIPIAGPIIHYIGEGEHAVWNDVWNFVKGAARNAIPDILAVEDAIVAKVVKTAEAYAGSLLQSFAGFVNDAVDYTHSIASSILGDISYIWSDLADGITYLDAAVYTILADVVGIDARIDEQIIPDLYNLGIDAAHAIDHAVANVEAWSIDNIYTPLDDLVKRVELTIPVWAEGAYTDAKAYADDLVHSEAARRAAAIAGLAASIAAINAWIDDCGEPMCQTLGPKTDLGKLLKGLKVATELAALTAFLNMDEAQLAAIINEVVARLATVVGDVEQFLGPGGETVAGLIANATKDLV